MIGTEFAADIKSKLESRGYNVQIAANALGNSAEIDITGKTTDEIVGLMSEQLMKHKRTISVLSLNFDIHVQFNINKKQLFWSVEAFPR